MRLNDVMQAIADRMATIAALAKTYPHPPDDTPGLPAAGCEWPESIVFDNTMGRGSDRMTLPVWVAVERLDDRAAWQKLSPFCDGAGASSVKAVLESGTYTAFSSARVVACQFLDDSIAGTPVLVALFTVDILGGGN